MKTMANVSMREASRGNAVAYLPQETLLEVRGVTLQYAAAQQLVTATYRVDFSIQSSDRFVLLGPSGCGKSTLLKAVGGYLEPTEGEISLRGKRVTHPGPDRMMVFQEFDQLLPWMSVLENVMFPLVETGKLGRAAARDKAMQYIEKVHLARVIDSYPHMLSRGMAMEPDILLMDEPFAALDALTRRQMQEELLQLWADTRFTLMFVTHSISEAIKIGNRILLLSPHPGEVVAELNSPPTDSDAPDWPVRLERKINTMLFGGAHADEEA